MSQTDKIGLYQKSCEVKQIDETHLHFSTVEADKTTMITIMKIYSEKGNTEPKFLESFFFDTTIGFSPHTEVYLLRTYYSDELLLLP